MNSTTRAAMVVIAAVATYAALAWSFWFVCDDAYISFRYAKNLADGHGLRFNLGDHLPVEGYSNFLWVLLAAAFERLDMAPATYVPGVSLLCGVGFLFTLYRVALDRFRFHPLHRSARRLGPRAVAGVRDLGNERARHDARSVDAVRLF